MAVELGTFYFDLDTSFPAVVVKPLDTNHVLVRVWTDSGDRTLAATRSDTAGVNMFVSDG